MPIYRPCFATVREWRGKEELSSALAGSGWEAAGLGPCPVDLGRILSPVLQELSVARSTMVLWGTHVTRERNAA